MKVSLSGLESLQGKLRRVRVRASNCDLEALTNSGTSTGELEGLIQHLEVDATDVKLKGAKLERVQLRLHDVRYDFKSFRKNHDLSVGSSGPGTLKVEFGYEQLGTAIALKLPGSMLTVKPRPDGSIQVDGTAALFGIKTSLHVVGKPVRFDGTTIGITASEIEVNSQRLTPDRFGPVEQSMRMDLRQWQPSHFSLELTKVRAEERALCVEANVSIQRAGSGP